MAKASGSKNVDRTEAGQNWKYEAGGGGGPWRAHWRSTSGSQQVLVFPQEGDGRVWLVVVLECLDPDGNQGGNVFSTRLETHIVPEPNAERDAFALAAQLSRL